MKIALHEDSHAGFIGDRATGPIDGAADAGDGRIDQSMMLPRFLASIRAGRGIASGT